MIRYPTGIAGLDSELDGGIDPGTLVALEIDSASQGDALLRHLAAQQPTLYVSTTRTKDSVEEWLQDYQLLIDMTHIQVKHTGPDRKLAAIDTYLDQLTQPVNVIIDPVDHLESGDEERYLETLHHLKCHIRKTDRIGYLHIQSGHGDDPRNGDHDWANTYRTVDMVWQLSPNVNDMTNNTRLVVTKRRAHATPEKPLELDIGRTITVDTSRNISL